MTPDERAIALAARIADGSAIDWPDPSTLPAGEDAQTLAQLKAIAGLAALHRAPALAGVASDQAAGSRWGPLILIDKIGEGRFGDVYRAWDPRLQRQVALKLLRASAVLESSSAHAIEEARLLARVRHPNVLTVHGAEVIDGQVGIWTEFIEGQTLERIVRERGPLPADEVIAIGVDLCRALTAVHGAGLLHRDIKAQNVMRETGGRIVLMDFGTGHDLDLIPARAGDFSGTPLYLAPEIFTGGSPSVASDLYALAVLLFYALTGKYPAPGRTLNDVRRSHQTAGVVRLTTMRQGVPVKLANAIERGLSALPSSRYEAAGAFETALTDSHQVLEPAPVVPTRRQARRGSILVVVGIMLMAGIATLFVLRDRWGAASVVNAPPAIDQLTVTGDVSLGQISLSGRLLVYLRESGGSRSIWLRTLSESESTKDVELVQEEEDQAVESVAIDPNDRFVFFVARRGSSKARELWRIAIDGRTSSRVATGIDSGASVSPDGRQIAFVRSTSEAATSLMIARPDGTDEHALLAISEPTSFLTFNVKARGPNKPEWSPNGRSIALLDRTPGQITIVDSLSGLRQTVVAGPLRSSGLTWLDDTRLLVAGSPDETSASQLWIVDTGTRAAEPLVQDVAGFSSLSVNYGRGLVVATRAESRGSIWLGGPTGQQAVQVVAEVANLLSGVSLDNDGGVVYTTQGPGGPSIWLVKSPGAAPQRVGAGAENAKITPDGRAILFAERNNPDRRGMYRVDVSTGQSSKLFEGLASEPTISPDGKTAYFFSNQRVWSVPVDGGEARQLTNEFTGRPPLVSPDGHTLIYAGRPSDNSVTVVACDLPDCKNPRQLALPDLAYKSKPIWQFRPDGAAIVFVSNDQDVNLWEQPLDGGPLRQVTNFSDRHIKRFAWSLDGTRLAIQRLTSTSDIVALKGLKLKK